MKTFTYLDVSGMPLSCFERNARPWPRKQTLPNAILSKCNELCGNLDRLAKAYKELPEWRLRSIPLSLGGVISNLKLAVERWRREVYLDYKSANTTTAINMGSGSPLYKADLEVLDACKDVFSLAIDYISSIERTWFRYGGSLEGVE